MATDVLSLESFRTGLPFFNSNRLDGMRSILFPSVSVVMITLSRGFPPDSGMNNKTDMVCIEEGGVALLMVNGNNSNQTERNKEEL